MMAHDQDDLPGPGTSHRHTVRATSIIGGAAIINIAFGLIRTKIAAIVLGPVGIGMIGLLQNLLNTAATVGGLNLGVSGARQIVASESANPSTAGAAERAVLLMTSVLALGSGLLFWLLREPLAALLFQDPGRATDVGWLAVGVAATAGAGYQVAVLTAARRIGDIARLNSVTAVMAALVGIACIVIWKSAGIVPFILATPVATLAFGWLFVRRAGRTARPVGAEPLRPHIVSLIRLGIALTSSIFVSLCGQLTIRTLVERELGPVALGHFQAAWTITTVYLAFIFQTMASDYLPRLTAVVNSRNHAQELVRSQAEVGILLAAPILLAMIGCGPWLISLLYTGEFVEATALLRYQMLGDLIRLAVWPVTLVLLADGASWEYAVTDIAGTGILVATTVILLPAIGLAAPGVAYIIMNLVVGAIVMTIVYRQHSVVLGSAVTRLFAVLVVCCVTVFIIGSRFTLAGALLGAAAASVWAAHAYFHLRPGSSFRLTKAGPN